MSINTKTIPLNQAGALELGMCPCDICEGGWANWTDGKEPEYCHQSCEYYKKYLELPSKEKIKFFGENIKGVIKSFKECLTNKR